MTGPAHCCLSLQSLSLSHRAPQQQTQHQTVLLSLALRSLSSGLHPAHLLHSARSLTLSLSLSLSCTATDTLHQTVLLSPALSSHYSGLHHPAPLSSLRAAQQHKHSSIQLSPSPLSSFTRHTALCHSPPSPLPLAGDMHSPAQQQTHIITQHCSLPLSTLSPLTFTQHTALSSALLSLQTHCSLSDSPLSSSSLRAANTQHHTALSSSTIVSHIQAAQQWTHHYPLSIQSLTLLHSRLFILHSTFQSIFFLILACILHNEGFWNIT